MSRFANSRASQSRPFFRPSRRAQLAACALSVLAGIAAPAEAAEAESRPSSASRSTAIRGRVTNAVNGAALPRAKVSIDGTNQETLTDTSGFYTLYNTPSGDVSVRVEYTGEIALTEKVVVADGSTAVRDFQFNSQQVKRTEDGRVVLDEFAVQADRYKNAQQIAINEERQSINIKNVISTDQFGTIPGGNLGEFVKFLPGVLVSYGSFGGNNQGYSDAEASGISVRGFGPESTTIMIDGMPVSNATPGSLTRQVGLDQLSINNASRVELIKVATPDLPSNSPGGQINLITKSAYEYAQPSYKGRVFFNFNSLNTSLRRTAGPVDKDTYKTTPGAEFTVAYPFSSTFGMSVTGSAANEFNQSYRAQPTLTTSGTVVNSAGQVVSLANPIISRYQITDTPRTTDRISGNLRLDWKPTPNQTLSGNVQYSTYDSVEAQRRLDARPTIGTGSNWDASKTIGTTANNTLDMVVTTRDKVGRTKSGQLQYNLHLGGWSVAAAGSLSISTGDFQDRKNGHFSEIGLKLNPGQVNLMNISDGGIVHAFEAYQRGSNTPLDYTKLANYGFDGTIAKSGESFSKSTVGLYKVDIERNIDFIPFLRTNPMAFKFGGRRDVEKTEKTGLGTGYQEILSPGKAYIVADILDTKYIGQSPGFSLPGQEWGSTYRLYEADQKQDLFYAPTDGADAITNYNSYVNQQKKITETTDAWYAMLTGRFFRNRLALVGGVRQEEKRREGFGPFTDSKWNFAKLANGTLYTDDFYRTGVKYDASGILRTNADGTTTNITNFLGDAALLSRLSAKGAKYPDHVYGPIGTSIESRQLNLIPNRYVNQSIKNDPALSLSSAFEITPELQVKAAWSRSFDLPKLEDTNQGLISGNNSFTINENSPIAADGTKGVISVANPGLLPSQSTNWDFEVTYYTKSGGKLSVSYYYKTVEGQSQTFSSFSTDPIFSEVLPALGLNPADYQDWRLTTSSNSTAKQNTQGYEFEVRQDFGFLGAIGKRFQVFASYTTKTLGDPPTVAPVTITSPNGTPISLTPTVRTITLTANRFAGAGLQYSDRRFSAQIRGTYRNDNELSNGRTALANGNFLRRFEPAETRFDLNLSYSFQRNLAVFVSGRDIFNAKRKQVTRDDQGILPSYARTFDYREFGVSWTVGVSGEF